jgi:hypothetical protein
MMAPAAEAFVHGRRAEGCRAAAPGLVRRLWVQRHGMSERATPPGQVCSAADKARRVVPPQLINWPRRAGPTTDQLVPTATSEPVRGQPRPAPPLREGEPGDPGLRDQRPHDTHPGRPPSDPRKRTNKRFGLNGRNRVACRTVVDRALSSRHERAGRMYQAALVGPNAPPASRPQVAATMGLLP